MTDRPELGPDPGTLGDEVAEVAERQSELSTRADRFESGLAALGEDITELRGTVARTTRGLQDVREDVAGLGRQVTETREVLDEFIEQYGRDREVARAQAELARLTTEWHATFGQRRQTRALARGLVHTLTAEAVQRNVVNTATVRACAEERMLLEPTYWLAPAAMAVAVRFGNETERFERACAHAQLLDTAKANLFFALTCSRLGDEREAAAWMDRYLKSLDPDELGQDFLVVLDAIASNELGEEALSYARQTVGRWHSDGSAVHHAFSHGELEDRLRALATDLPDDRFGALRAMCRDRWPALRSGWELATIPAGALGHLRAEYPDTADAPGSPSGEGRHVLHALERLINQMEPDEASMHDAMQWQQSIVEHGGDLDAARASRTPLHTGGGEPVTISTLLDRAVFAPDEVQLGEAARRMALRAVWPGLETALHRFVAHSAGQLPQEMSLEIEGWTCTVPTDPRAAVELAPLAEELSGHIDARTELASEAVVRRWPHVITAVLGGTLIGTLVVPYVDSPLQPVFGLLTVLAVVWVVWELCRVPVRRWMLRDEASRQRSQAQSVLREALRERPVFFQQWTAGLASVAELDAWGEERGIRG
ncbi:hypothetical protein [Streptomyces sp. Da 82-17]|uniref:hypothetical protein n=1 Tax=Streptomyces sp. Da 82-17 TaxID=3377116 RepID=UPI0038D4455F